MSICLNNLKISLGKKIFATLAIFFLIYPFDASSAQKESPLQTHIVGISHPHKFVWFRVAKVGSSTIKAIFHRNNVDLSIMSSRFLFNPREYKDYFKFAFVRNPWDRVVSCYCQKVENKNPKWAHYYEECFDKGFEYFIDFIDRQDLVTADRHIRLQTALIPVNEVNFIGRLENFSNDLSFVLSFIGVKDREIPKKNPSNHAHYSQYYNERTKEIIARKYKKDIETFGYSFEMK